jgi:hypothetical protein
MAPARIDVTKEFAECVRSIGGTVLDDVLKAPDFKNADFLFPEYNVVAELKCLTEDPLKDLDFHKRITALHKSWADRGLVATNTGPTLSINLRGIPEICAYEMLAILRKKFESKIITRANKQIRETKARLDADDAKGILIIANDGNSLYPPSLLAHVVARSIGSEHRNIHGVIYFTANVPAFDAIDGEPRLFWIDGIFRDRVQAPKALRVALQNAWHDRYSLLTGSNFPIISIGQDADALDALQFTQATKK